MIPHHRHSIRLKEYDYCLPGAYFVTLVCSQRESLFGDIMNGEMCLNSTGKVVLSEWYQLKNHFQYLQTDALVIMPNHMHGILVIEDNVGATHPATEEVISDHLTRDIQIDDTNTGSPRPGVCGTSFLDETGATRLSSITTIGKIESINASYEADSDGSPLLVHMAKGPQPGSIGAIIGQFKSRSTKRIWRLPGLSNRPIWQRNYYEHIIRNENELQKIILYIENNPVQWEEDQYYRTTG
jgi:putative transposase